MTYDDVAHTLDITRCESCPRGDHRRGWADISVGVIHFSDRRLERRGLRIFLKLVASVIYCHNRGQPLWRKLYEQNTWAYKTALTKFGIKFRSSYADEDRARSLYASRNERLATTYPAAYRWMTKESSK